MLFFILGLESDVPTPVACAEVPTPPDSEEDMDLSPDIGPDQDRDPSPWPEIADQELELEDSGTGRQKASAHLHPFHPLTVIAKLCSTSFKKGSRRILENVRQNYAVPPGTQPEAIESNELWIGMKHAAVDISLMLKLFKLY